MRKIITQDIFKMARIIRTIQIKDVLADMFQKGMNISKDYNVIEKISEEEKEKLLREYEQKKEEFGVNAVFTILENCSDAKTEEKIYELLGGILEKRPEDIAGQSLEVTINDIKAIIKENDLADFFEKACQLNR